MRTAPARRRGLRGGPAGIETLESRMLLAMTVTALPDGTVTVETTPTVSAVEPRHSAPASAASPNDVIYSGPLIITQGGTYRGNWESLDPAVPAVTVRTSEPVIIQYSHIRGRGVLIRTSGFHADLTIRHSRGYGLNPDVYGVPPGRFLEADGFDNIVVENNYLEGTAGMKLLEYWGDHTSGDSIRIVGNSALNIDGRLSDGAGGFLDFDKRTRLSDGLVERGYRIRQFVQLDKVQNVPGIEIAWNQVINEPGRSRVEDNINIFQSSGTMLSPIRIHNNYIQGAYTVRPWQGGKTTDGVWEYDWGYAGGGILLGDGTVGTAYVHAHDNQVVSTTNHGIGTASGHDMISYRNRVVSSGWLPDGRWIAGQNVGMYIWDFYGTGALFYNNSGFANQVGWARDPSGARNDWWVPNAAVFESNVRWAGEITLQTEAEEFALWRNKLALAGVSVGPSEPAVRYRPGPRRLTLLGGVLRLAPPEASRPFRPSVRQIRLESL